MSGKKIKTEKLTHILQYFFLGFVLALRFLLEHLLEDLLSFL